MASTPSTMRNSVTALTAPIQVSTPGARLPQRAIDWEVRDERVEFTVRPGCIERSKALFELVVAEPPLSHRVV